MDNRQDKGAMFTNRLAGLVEAALPVGQVADWEATRDSLSSKTAAVLVHALHGWIRTVRNAGGKRGPYVQEGLIHPLFWHCSPFNAVVLTLLNRGCLAPAEDGTTLRLTLKGLWFSLQPTDFLPEIRAEYHQEEVEQAIMLLLQAHKVAPPHS
jgi:hypothetical protein